LIETVSKKPIQPWQRSVIVEVMVETIPEQDGAEGEDVEVRFSDVLYVMHSTNVCVTGPVRPRPLAVDGRRGFCRWRKRHRNGGCAWSRMRSCIDQG
jgi:hypothetical protein